MIEIPRRPDNDDEYSSMTKNDKNILLAKVLLELPNNTIYALFNPHFTEGRNFKLNEAGRSACRQFFSHPKHEQWIKDYERTLDNFIKGKRKQKAEKPQADISEEQKDHAIKLFLNQVVSLIESGAELDPDSLKAITEILRKIGWLKDDNKLEDRPYRFLPATCSRCRMNMSMTSLVVNGEMFDCCAYCKARKIAEENGFDFNDGKDLLDVPQEIVEELYDKIDVDFKDIVDGKVEN